jgi:hypothetical protein
MFWSKWMVHENGLHSDGFNPRPLSHESSALTTRPWLLATISDFYFLPKLTLSTYRIKFPTINFFSHHLPTYIYESFVIYVLPILVVSAIGSKVFIDFIKQQWFFLSNNIFVVVVSVAIHMSAVHEKRRPYQCDVCHNNFGIESNMLKHKEQVLLLLNNNISNV